MKNNYFKPKLSSEDSYDITGKGKVKTLDFNDIAILLVNQMLEHYMKEEIPISLDNEDVLIKGIESFKPTNYMETQTKLGILYKEL